MRCTRWAPFAIVGTFVLGCGKPADPPNSLPMGQPQLVDGKASDAPKTPQEMAAQADVPVYPGAKFPDGMTKPPSADPAGKMHTYLVMTTPDSPAKVAKFYEKSGGHYSDLKTKEGIEVQGMSPKGDLVLIDVTSAGGLTTISVKSVSGS